MSAGSFYNIYAKFTKRGSNLRLKVTPFGIIVIASCLISGLAGLNIFASGLYRVFSLTFSVLIISYLSKLRSFSNISAAVFFDRQYNSGEPSKYSIKIFNDGQKDLFDLEIIPAIQSPIPSKNDFLMIREPGEDKRNIWDRNIYYFRWAWHILRLHKAEFKAVKVRELKHNSFKTAEASLSPVRRGNIRFEGFYITKKDIFGIFTSFQFFPAPEDIVIYPKKVKLDPKFRKKISSQIEIKNRLFSNQFNKHKSGDFVGLREYVPGDPVKNIHWKTWAKTGKPAVIEKGFEKIKEYSIVLFNIAKPDQSRFITFFEDCLSYLYSTIKFLEESEYEINFYYFSKEGNILSFKAENERGNFSVLYGIIAKMEYFQTTERIRYESVKSVLNSRMNSLFFTVSPDAEILKISADIKPLMLYCESEGKQISESIKIPKINDPVLQVNTV